jgi:peroxiredoxin
VDTQIVGISTDFTPTLSHWAGELKLEYPLASDKLGKVSQLYGVYNANVGIASRSTFVVDMEGKITYIEEGGSAVDPTGAVTACSRLKK